MPIKWLVRYWEKAGSYTLPFLQNRKIAVQQVFDGKILYRRHGGRGLPDRIGWITVKNQTEISEWANLHTYSFHPHLAGDKDVWFVMDIDGRTDKMFDLTKLATYELTKILDRYQIKYLLKFSGHRGFHIMWSLGKIRPNWLGMRRQIRQYAQELEEVLQLKYQKKFYQLIPKKQSIITTSSTDKNTNKAILIDEQIVHKNGMIRSPYSIHPTIGLVSIPLKPTQLLKFKPSSANPNRVKSKNIVLPQN